MGQYTASQSWNPSVAYPISVRHIDDRYERPRKESVDNRKQDEWFGKEPKYERWESREERQWDGDEELIKAANSIR